MAESFVIIWSVPQQTRSFHVAAIHVIYAVILSTPALWNTIPDKMILRFTILYYPFSSNSLTDQRTTFFYQTFRPTRRTISRQINFVCLRLQCISEAPGLLLNSCPDGDKGDPPRRTTRVGSRGSFTRRRGEWPAIDHGDKASWGEDPAVIRLVRAHRYHRSLIKRCMGSGGGRGILLFVTGNETLKLNPMFVFRRKCCFVV